MFWEKIIHAQLLNGFRDVSATNHFGDSRFGHSLYLISTCMDEETECRSLYFSLDEETECRSLYFSMDEKTECRSLYFRMDEETECRSLYFSMDY